MPISERQRTWPLLAAILALGTLLRLPGLFGKTLWYDEAYSAFFASRSLGEIIRLSGYDSSPGLFAVLLSFWSRITGDGAAALAAFSVLLSVASVAVVYLIGKEMADRRAGLIAALLVAVNPLHIRYAVEVRAYSLLFLIAALSVLFLQRMVKRGVLSDGACWAASIVLGMYCHYTFIIAVLLEALVLALWAARQPARWRVLVGLFAAAAAAYVPNLLLFHRWGDLIATEGPASFFRRGFSHGDLGTVLTFFSSLAFGERSFYPLTVFGEILTIATGLIVIGAVAFGIDRSRRELVALALGASTFAGIALLMAGRFIHSPRYYLVFVLPLALFAASVLARLSYRRLAAAMAVILVCSLAPAAIAVRPASATAFTYYAKPFAETLARESQSGDVILVDHFTDILFRRYPPGKAETRLFFPKQGRNVTDMAERFGQCDFNYMSEADIGTLAALTEGRSRVWTVDYLPQRTSIQDPDGLKRRWFEEHFRLAKAVEFPEDAPAGTQKIVLLLYERP